MRQFVSIQAPDSVFQRLQDAIAAVFRDVTGKEILDGQLIEGLKLSSASSDAIPHGLGRKYRGFLVVRRSANAVVWESPATDPKKFIVLNTSVDVTVSLWVF